MPRDDGRIVIIADITPKKLLRITEDIAVESGCRIADLRDDTDDGFHITAAKGDPPVYTVLTLARMAAGGIMVPLDIAVTARETKAGDGKLILDWVETGNSLRATVCRDFTRSLADELEDRVEDAGGRIIESYDD